MPTDGERARLLEAIAAAGDEVGLDAWYRSSVEPLMNLADRDMPRCCGGGCEPCMETLIEVAVRARRRLAATTEA